MFGTEPNRCEICGLAMSCGRCLDGPCHNCPTEICNSCKEVVALAREQRAYLKEYHSKKK